MDETWFTKQIQKWVLCIHNWQVFKPQTFNSLIISGLSLHALMKHGGKNLITWAMHREWRGGGGGGTGWNKGPPEQALLLLPPNWLANARSKDWSFSQGPGKVWNVLYPLPWKFQRIENTETMNSAQGKHLKIKRNVTTVVCPHVMSNILNYTWYQFMSTIIMKTYEK